MYPARELCQSSHQNSSIMVRALPTRDQFLISSLFLIEDEMIVRTSLFEMNQQQLLPWLSLEIWAKKVARRLFHQATHVALYGGLRRGCEYHSPLAAGRTFWDETPEPQTLSQPWRFFCPVYRERSMFQLLTHPSKHFHLSF